MEHIYVFWIIAVSVMLRSYGQPCQKTSKNPCIVDLSDLENQIRTLYIYSFKKDVEELKQCTNDIGNCRRTFLKGNVEGEKTAVIFKKSTLIVLTEEEIHVVNLCNNDLDRSIPTASTPATFIPCLCSTDRSIMSNISTFTGKPAKTTPTTTTTTTMSAAPVSNTPEVKPTILRQTDAKTFKAADIVISCVFSFVGGAVSVIIVICSRNFLMKRLLTKSSEDPIYAVENDMNKAEKEKQTYEMLNKPSCSDGLRNSGDHVYLGMNDDQPKHKHTGKLDNMKARGSLEATPGAGFDEYSNTIRVSSDEHIYAAIKSSQSTVIPKESRDEEPDYEANKDHSYVILEKETEGVVLETNDTFTVDTDNYQSAVEDHSYFTLQKAE